MSTSIDKVLYFPDEMVRVKLQIDNRASQRRIQSISCFLRQTVSIMKDKHDERKGYYMQKKFDLHKVIISKASFEDTMTGKSAGQKRVFGRFLVEMNLKEIFSQI